MGKEPVVQANVEAAQERQAETLQHPRIKQLLVHVKQRGRADQVPSRFQDAADLGQRLLRLRQVFENGNGQHGLERFVSERHAAGIALAEAAITWLLAASGQASPGDVEAHVYLAAQGQPREFSGAAAQIQHGAKNWCSPQMLRLSCPIKGKGQRRNRSVTLEDLFQGVKGERRDQFWRGNPG